MICRLMLNLKRVPVAKADPSWAPDDYITHGTTIGFGNGSQSQVLSDISAFAQDIDVSCSPVEMWVDEANDSGTENVSEGKEFL